jgi:hypothetical protein
MLAVYISVTCEAYKHNTHLKHGQGGLFPGKGGRIFPGSIEISQEILVENPTLCSFLKSSHTNMFSSKKGISCHKNNFPITKWILVCYGNNVLSDYLFLALVKIHTLSGEFCA